MEFELDHVSHSQLNLWERCPRQWQAKYVRGIWTPSSDALIVGSCYHSVLEENFKFKIETGEELDLDIAYDVLDTAWNKYLAKNSDIRWLQNTQGNAKDLTFALAAKYIEEISPTVDPLQVEKWYETFIGDTKFVLRMDLMLKSGAVVDHKTSGRAYTESAVHRDPQATASAFVLDRPIVFYNHVAIKTKTPRIQVIKSMRNNADIAWWYTKAEAIIEHMKSGYAPPRDDGWWCNPRYCGIYNDCMKDLARTIYT